MFKNPETHIYRFFLIGIGCCAIGIPLFVMFGLARGNVLLDSMGALGVLLTIAGIILFGFGLVTGFIYNSKAATGPEKVLQGARVVSRMITDSRGEFIQDWQIDETSRYLIKLAHPSFGMQEFECVEPVFNECPEGGAGEAVVQGRWLSRFVLYRGVGLGRPDDPRFGQSVPDEQPKQRF